MSFSESRRNLQLHGKGARSFGERFADALRRRLHPNTTLTVQRLAGLFRLSERTIWMWLSGNGCRGEHLAAAIGLFGIGFAEEVCGPAPRHPDDETERLLVRMETELARIRAERSQRA